MWPTGIELSESTVAAYYLSFLPKIHFAVLILSLLSISGYISMDSLRDLETGDVLLMNRKCLRMKNLLASAICAFAKIESPYDHVGMIVKTHPEELQALPRVQEAIEKQGGISPSGTYIVESNMNGVTLRGLEKRLSLTSSNAVAVRPLCRSSDIASKNLQLSVLYNLQYALVKRYKESPSSFLAAAFCPPDKLDRFRAFDKLRIIENEISILRRYKVIHTGSNEQFILKLIAEYERAFDFLAFNYFEHAMTFSLRALDVGRHTMKIDGANVAGSADGVFCSELIAQLWQNGNVIEVFPPAGTYKPSSFASGSPLTLKYPFELGKLQVIQGNGSVKRIARHEQQHAGEGPFSATRLATLSDIRKSVGAEPFRTEADVLAVVPPAKLVPMPWLVQSTAYPSDAGQLPLRLTTLGLLFTFANIVTAPIARRTVEVSMGIPVRRGSLATFAAYIGFRGIAMTSLLSSSVWMYVHVNGIETPVYASAVAKVRWSSNWVDLRHPFYAIGAPTAGFGVTAWLLANPIQRMCIGYHVSPTEPATFFARKHLKFSLFPNSVLPSSAVWLVWFELLGPWLYPTRYSILRRRPEGAKMEVSEQAFAVSMACTATACLDLMAYQWQTPLRRRFARSFYKRNERSSIHLSTRFWKGIQLRLASIAVVYGITVPVIWKML